MTAPILHRQRLPPRANDRVDLVIEHPMGAVATGVLLFSPQPLLGGDRDNNVMSALSQAFAAQRAAIRFDYRGVGASHDVAPGVARYEYWLRVEAEHDHVAVLEDAREALERASRLCEVVAFAGYSFGAYVALRLAAEVGRPLPLVLVAPPLGRLDFSRLAEHRGDVLLVTASRDALDPPPSSDEIRARFPRVEHHELTAADHFLRGNEGEVGAVAAAFLARSLVLPRGNDA